ncbi:MAG: prepilin-type N-terminal cleavage/methylation protein [Rhodoferax sp.]|nr:prepilin-type N-terminal cleavage/methylation protein [Rhodoferax sp.]
MLAMMTRRHHGQQGFTLIELLSTLTVAAVLMMVAVPSVLTFKRNSELTSATNTLLSSINVARGEAMKRGTNAIMTPTNGATWNDGWIVFVYVYAAGRTTDTSGFTYDAAYDKLIQQQPALPSYISVAGNGNTGITNPYIMYDASGYSRTKGSGPRNATLSISRNDVSSSDQIRRIKIAVTGRARACNPATDTSCTNTLE